MTIIICKVHSFDNNNNNNDQQSNDPKRCMEFEVNEIDAITYMNNGSRLIIIDNDFWMLNDNLKELPTIQTKRSIIDLISTKWQPRLETILQKLQTIDSNRSEIDLAENNQFRIDAAVNIKLKAENGRCVPTNQLLIYSTLPNNNGPLITVHENDHIYSSSNLSEFDILRAVKSVDFTKNINGMTYFNNMTIIFQGKYFTTIRCVNGEWSEIFHKEIDQAFPKAMIDPDSVDMSSSNNEIQYDNTYVLLFYRQQYLACSVLGDSPCEGPYNVMSELFNVDHLCFNLEDNDRYMIVLSVFAIIALVILSIIAMTLYGFFKKPVNMNEKQHVSYSSLKTGNDNNTTTATGIGSESKPMSTTNGKS
ncbi:hypothetical protein HUG17_0270 [Dermatophagoides farinae]|uniref:Uncharacterized protein n=1 Tax=Dermatophagoides farinae TaxID=6954 RepID=A0A9D4P6F4_DERFA|nr:uncharacterized protein LOC124499085 [Dermatophagoides farinae]KAH7644732.1 hypothetical protein HUG17_0270 [Dermatophagoides farinae]